VVLKFLQHGAFGRYGHVLVNATEVNFEGWRVQVTSTALDAFWQPTTRRTQAKQKKTALSKWCKIQAVIYLSGNKLTRSREVTFS